MKRLVSLFFAICLVLTLSSNVFAQDVGISNKNNVASNGVEVLKNDQGQTIYRKGGSIPEGVQITTWDLYSDGNYSRSSSDASSQRELLGSLVIWIDATNSDIYSGWTVTMDSGVLISYVNLSMKLQKSGFAFWSSVDSRLFKYNGVLSNREDNATDFLGLSSGYYRTYMTGSITTVTNGTLTMTPANSSTVSLPAPI
ncbi:MAG: hypothetical protein K0Q90_1012 [Paenibacillaceae bacterium]|nr:hypothetical protein [Paenibacillaceae bacterium]